MPPAPRNRDWSTLPATKHYKALHRANKPAVRIPGKEPLPGMTAEGFQTFVRDMWEQNGWSGRYVAHQLGCGVNQVAVWKQRGAPRYIGLAVLTIRRAMEKAKAANPHSQPKLTQPD